MSRELKFRIYVPQDKGFVYFGLQDYPQGIYGAVSEPMQFTGLLDKNEKEIYEGDIVQYISPFSKVGTFDNIFTIIYEYGKFRLKHIKSGEIFVDFSESNYFNTVQSSEIEIIANINENK